MAVVLTKIEREIIDCDGCMIFNPNRRPWKRRLANGRDPIVWIIHTGNSIMDKDSDNTPIHSRIVACRPHEDALIERGGWDGTGVRQAA